MISYSVDHKGVYQVNFIGRVEYMDIVKWLAEFSEIQPISENLYMVYNLLTVDLKLDPLKLLKIAQRSDEATSNYVKVRTAFALTRNLLRSYVFLFSFLKSGNTVIRKAFDNIDSAYEWVIEQQSTDLAFYGAK